MGFDETLFQVSQFLGSLLDLVLGSWCLAEGIPNLDQGGGFWVQPNALLLGVLISSALQCLLQVIMNIPRSARHVWKPLFISILTLVSLFAVAYPLASYLTTEGDSRPFLFWCIQKGFSGLCVSLLLFQALCTRKRF